MPRLDVYEDDASDEDASERAYTSDDYWNLPDGSRAELIDGKLYAMTPPSWTHQRIVAGLTFEFEAYIRAHGGPCQVALAPVAVNLDANDHTWVEPDVVVVCDPDKISERGCEGAPDLVVEVVSPSSIRMDYFTKAARYQQAGVREYWIVDPATKQVVVYRYDGEESPQLGVYSFAEAVPVGIFDGLTVTVADLV